MFLVPVVSRSYKGRQERIPEELIWKYWIQVVVGLQALHNMRILHRDVKPVSLGQSLKLGREKQPGKVTVG